MTIIHAPHPSLRQATTSIARVDKKLSKFIHQLSATLDAQTNPRGVGLAAPQVDRSLPIFVTRLEEADVPEWKLVPPGQIFINPRIEKHSSDQTFGPDPKRPLLEGCLSIPGLYGPVPRWEWVELSFDQLEGDSLVRHSLKLENYPARVAQHELDHLHGILYTDYTLKYDLPLYKEDPVTKDLTSIELDVLEYF
jgi:peptide deformylase